MMECAALSSYLVRQSGKTFPVSSFESAGFDRCVISWFDSRLAEIIDSVVAAGL